MTWSSQHLADRCLPLAVDCRGGDRVNMQGMSILFRVQRQQRVSRDLV